MDMKTSIDLIDELAHGLESIEGILGIAITDQNGILVSSRLPTRINGRNFGAMAATIVGAIETAIKSLKDSELVNLTVDFDRFRLIAIKALNHYIIVSLVEKKANIGLIFIELEEFIKELNYIMSV